jgi:hypothetical protein
MHQPSSSRVDREPIMETPSNNWMQLTRPAPRQLVGAVLAADPGVMRTGEVEKGRPKKGPRAATIGGRFDSMGNDTL